MAQDSTKPEFWDARYRDGVTPWDAGGTPPQLGAWLARQAERIRVLLPGCGSAHEVGLFVAHGCEVLAIDFSDAACAAARANLGGHAHLLVQADFFSFDGDAEPFDLIYERAFLCALPRRAWPDWGKRSAALLEPAFELEEDAPVPAAHSIPVFRHKERWQVWRRR